MQDLAQVRSTVTPLDTATVDHVGVTFHIEVHPDDFSDPYDADPDCFSYTDLATWQHDWRFVTITITPLVDGQPNQDAAFDKTGLPYGDTPTWTITTEDLVRRAIDDGWCDLALAKLQENPSCENAPASSAMPTSPTPRESRSSSPGPASTSSSQLKNFFVSGMPPTASTTHSSRRDWPNYAPHVTHV